MLAYVCTCGYVGFLGNDRYVRCVRCGVFGDGMHGCGEVNMNTEEKIQEFINAVNLEKPKPSSGPKKILQKIEDLQEPMKKCD
jgi:hypothetical protein